MKKISFILLCLGCFLVGKTQDIHFSQISQTPLYYNPANTGNFNGDQRIFLNYRNQWQSISNAFRTFAVSAESVVLQEKINAGKLFVGGYVYSDQAGQSKLSHNSIILSSSFTLKLSSKSFLTVGVNGGASQRSISPDNLEWDNQYDVINGYDSSIDSEEIINNNGFISSDFGSGINYKYEKLKKSKDSKDQIVFNVGIAAYHINKPKLDYNELRDERFYRKYIFNTNFSYTKYRSKISYIPHAVFVIKNNSNEILMGGRIRYVIQKGSKRSKVDKSAISIGTTYRYKDALIYSVNIEYANYAMGISYDYNNSDLKIASNGKGGIEISLRMITPNPFSLGSKSKYIDF